jgi:predicted anti-sigma-YlaC factor YlaD
MSCDEVQAQLTALLDGELTPEAASGIEAHLVVCKTCSEARDEMRAVLEMAKAWQVDGSDVLTAVQQQISQEDMHALLLEMKRLRGEIVALRAEVAELKSRVGKRDATAEREIGILRFPYATARDSTRPLI